MSTVKVNFVCATDDVLGVSSNSGAVSSTSVIENVTVIGSLVFGIASLAVTVKL